MITPGQVDVAARYLGDKFGARPRVAVILGSGIPRPAVTVAAEVPFAKVPHMAAPTVTGHAGLFVLGRAGAEGDAVLIVDGRLHWFEGHAVDVVTLPARICARLGVQTLIATGTVGSLRPALAPGDVAALRDHINFSGVSPLRAPHDNDFGPRFVAPADAYDAGLRLRARDAARNLGWPLKEATYVWVGGPSYETAAEAAMLATFGGDVVGMSVVPEVLAARQAGMDVLGLAVVVNVAGHAAVNHDDVLAKAGAAGERAAALIASLLPTLARPEP